MMPEYLSIFEITICDLNWAIKNFMNKTALVLANKVDSKIQVLRGQKIILDSDLAELYGVPVRQLNQQIKRNAGRFPADFLFQLSPTEYQHLRSHFVISNVGRGGRRYLPHAFTEHGAIMAATVLNSKRAIEMSIFVVRAFVRMRETLAANQQIVTKLSEIERRLEGHDAEIQELVDAIRELMAPLPANTRRIGFEAPANPARKNARAKTSA
jgi:phage regulator Rha-like protein